MQTRSYSHHGSFGASARRRIRRTTTSHRLYCRTNGCTTYLQLDPDGQTATCPICGAARTLS